MILKSLQIPDIERTSENPLLHKAMRIPTKIIKINIFRAVESKGL